MSKSILSSLVVLAVLVQIVLARNAHSDWSQYKLKHGKAYETPEEESRRFSLFLAASEKVQRHNALNLSYKLGLNHLSDWTPEERAKLSGYRSLTKYDQAKDEEAMKFLAELESEAPRPPPKEVDWRKQPGRVSSVKDQGQCGSCWAFSTVGVLEGQEVLRSGGNGTSLKSLSPQNLVDCSASNYGCDGGYPAYALTDIQKEGGIESDADYPYTGAQVKCRFAREKAAISDDGALEFLNKTEDVLQSLVANYGPVAVGLAADNWESYQSGVFDDVFCLNDLGHAVLVVGYGTDPQSGDFWIVKNSWSETWGENGYIRIRRGVTRCGFGLASFLPKFNK